MAPPACLPTMGTQTTSPSAVSNGAGSVLHVRLHIQLAPQHILPRQASFPHHSCKAICCELDATSSSWSGLPACLV